MPTEAKIYQQKYKPQKPKGKKKAKKKADTHTHDLHGEKGNLAQVFAFGKNSDWRS